MGVSIRYLAILLLVIFSCQPTSPPAPSSRAWPERVHPAWSRHAVVYELNVRQYTPEGTFTAILPHLDRLRKLGVDIIWLMPIQPIGKKNRKGSLGSYYSIKDYTAINPEFGPAADFRQLVDSIHAKGMYVILDWVANHTAWDHPWANEHPDWYQQDPEGQFVPPLGSDWSDVIALNYEAEGVREAMASALRYWVAEYDIDGYRCDVAGFVPRAFWHDVRVQLDSIKPVWMLAEWNARDLHDHAFDATYGWSFHEAMQKVRKGEMDAAGLKYTLAEWCNSTPLDDYQMLFTTNHDKNAWEGTLAEFFGPLYEVFVVLTFTAEGIPLIYSGQEAGFDEPLAFFEKDTIIWKKHYMEELFQALAHLKSSQPALWNGDAGGKMWPLITDNEAHIYSFVRIKAGYPKVLVTTNLSDTTQAFTYRNSTPIGRYTSVFSNDTLFLQQGTGVTLPAFGYEVWIED